MPPDRPTTEDRMHAINRKAWRIVHRGGWWAITPRGLPLPCASWEAARQRATWQRPTWTHQTQIH